MERGSQAIGSVMSGVAACLLSTWLSAAAGAQSLQFQVGRARVSFLPDPLFELSTPASATDVKALVAADLDGDGTSEVLVSVRNRLLMYSRSTAGWAHWAFAYPVGRVACRDLDGDGDLDLFHRADGEPFVLRNDGGLQFTRVTTPLDGMQVLGLDFGDLDGDGVLDLIGCGYFSGFQVCPGMGALQFGPNSHPGLPVGLGSCAAGDFDGDSDTDVMLFWSSPRLLANNGGVLTQGVTGTNAGVGTVTGVVADMDQDGQDDLVTGTHIVWGGGLLAPTLLSANTQAFDVGDPDGDGDLDVSTGSIVFRNGGGRRFSAQAGPSPPSIGAVDVVDFDLDGTTDTLVFQPGGLQLYAGSASAIEDIGRRRLPDGLVQRHAYWDVDGDGRLDVVNQHVHRSVGHLEFERMGPQWAAGSLLSGAVWPTDFDGDGDLDCLVEGSTTVRAVENLGNGLREGPPVPIQPGAPRDHMVLGPVDGVPGDDMFRLADNRIELIRFANGTLTVQTVATFAGIGPWPTCLERIDVNGDGVLELAIGMPATSRVLFASGPSLGPGPMSPIQLASPPHAMASGDISGDGIVDLAVMTDRGLELHLGTGQGFVNATAQWLPGGGPRGLIATPGEANMSIADLDEDGDLDIISGIGDGSYLRNDGGSFAEMSGRRIPAVLFATMLLLDADDDGDLDIHTNGGHLLYNHVRQLVDSAAPYPGAAFAVDLYSGPGFSPTGLGIVVLALNAAQAPLAVPGLRGRIDLDLATARVASMALLSPIGVSRRFVAIPPNPALVGTQFFLQGLILSNGPQFSGVTNSLREVILR